MSEYGVARDAGTAAGAADGTTVAPASADGESWFERQLARAGAEPEAARAESRDEAELSGAEMSGAGELSGEAEPAAEADGADLPDPDQPEPVEDYVDSDPQQWISGLIADLERAEQGIGSGPRDVLMARIKLAQAYSELGDMVQAAPLAVANLAQAQRLFPSSEGMLRQLREFRDAACEAAGWTAAMMREPDEMDEADDSDEAGVYEGTRQEPSELVARPWAQAVPEQAAEQAVPEQLVPEQTVMEQAAAEQAITGDSSEPTSQPWPVAEAVAQAWPAVEPGDDEEMLLGVEPEPAGTPEHAEHTEHAEPAGAVIHEFVRRTPEADTASWSAEIPSPAPSPAELAIPGPPEPEYAEEVEPTAQAADLAAFEEIIRLRYELREAHRTIERLKHVNRKLREALDFDGA